MSKAKDKGIANRVAGEVVGRCGGGPKEMYLHPAEGVRISSHTKSQWDNPRQSHGGVTDGN